MREVSISSPTGKSDTKTNQRLHHIVDTTEIHNMLSDKNNGDEHEWKDSLWKIPDIQVWRKILFKFVVFTDLINREFVNHLTSLQHDVTSGPNYHDHFLSITITIFMTLCSLRMQSLFDLFYLVVKLVRFLLCLHRGLIHLCSAFLYHL